MFFNVMFSFLKTKGYDVNIATKKLFRETISHCVSYEPEAHLERIRRSAVSK